MISEATNTIDKAMVASTGGPGTWITPMVANANVTECARVNAVTVISKRLVPRTIITNASTNSR